MTTPASPEATVVPKWARYVNGAAALAVVLLGVKMMASGNTVYFIAGLILALSFLPSALLAWKGRTLLFMALFYFSFGLLMLIIAWQQLPEGNEKLPFVLSIGLTLIAAVAFFLTVACQRWRFRLYSKL